MRVMRWAMRMEFRFQNSDFGFMDRNCNDALDSGIARSAVVLLRI